MFYLPFVVALFSLIFSGFLVRRIKCSLRDSGKIAAVANSLQKNAVACWKRQCKLLSAAALFLFLLIWLFLGVKIGLGFLAGVFFSGIAGLMGAIVSVKANVRAAEGVKQGLRTALKSSFQGGSAAGFLLAGLGFSAVGGCYMLSNDLKVLVGLCLGVSLAPFFTSLTGDVNAKKADIGTDLFQTYVIGLAAAMILGELIFPNQSIAVILPLYLGSVAVLASIIGSFFVKIIKNQSIKTSLYKWILSSIAFTSFGFIWIVKNAAISLNFSFFQLYLSAIIGLILAGLMILMNNIIIIVGLAFGILISFQIAGIYGVAVTAVSVLSLAGIMIAIDSFASNEVGGTTGIVIKNYAICSAGLAVLVLFASYAHGFNFYLSNSKVLAGLLIGGLLPYFVNYSIVLTVGASVIKKIFLSAIIPITAPLLVGFILGAEALGGLLIGAWLTGILSAIFSADRERALYLNSIIKVSNIIALLIIVFLN